MGTGPKLERQTQIALGEALRTHLAPSWNRIPPQLVDLWRRVQEIDQQALRMRRGESAGAPPTAPEGVAPGPYCFDPETLSSLGAALNESWATLAALDGAASEVSKERVAERILELAAEGERSAPRLASKAVISLIAPQARGRFPS